MSEKKSRGREEREDDRNPKGRRRRIPMGGMHLKLDAPKRPGFIRRWAAGRGMNLDRYKDAGYEFVTDEHTIDEAGDGQGSRVTKTSGGELLYLMEIREDWYDEDQAAKQAELDEIDEQMRRGRVEQAQPQDAGQFYAGSKSRGDILVETLDGKR